MITYGIYVNDNGLITYNEIPTFIIDLLNHQAMLINTMALVAVNILQSASCREAILLFPTKSVITSNEEKNNTEEKK